jgi:hypothetical protein
VSDGARTRDNRDHNPVLYQLSYTHHGVAEATADSLSGRMAAQSGITEPGAGGTTCAAAAFAASVSGPGSGTKTVDR